MLLLVTVGLVLAGLILLIVGFVQDSLTLIYLSIACAAVAGLALIVFSRLSRRRAVTMAAGGIPAATAPPSPGLVPAGVAPGRAGDRPAAAPAARPAPRPSPQEFIPAPSSESAEPTEQLAARHGSGGGVQGFDPGEPTTPQPVPRLVREPAPATARTEAARNPEPVASAGDLIDDEDWNDDWGDEVVFPIEDYDELRVAEIVPLLPELDPDELEEVRDREVAGKSRGSILSRIDELLGIASPAAVAPARPAARKAAQAGKAAAAGKAAQAGKAAAPATKKAAPGRVPAKAAKATGAGKRAPLKATKAPAPTPAPARAPAKKASSKAAPAPAPAKKAVTAKKAAPAKKAAKEAAPAAPPNAKKASPAKKAAPATSAAPPEKPARKRTPRQP